MLLRPNEWKSLRSRYEEDKPHRMLALDGGGIRGLITLGLFSTVRWSRIGRDPEPLILTSSMPRE